MSNFFSKYKYIIIAILVIFAIFIGYGFMKPASEGDSGLSKTVVANDAGGFSNANGLAGELSDSFVIQLLAIQNINFNTEFFNDPVYRGLIDQSRDLGTRPVGRPNPFYPIGQDNGFVGGTTSGLTGASGNGTGSSSGTFTITSTSSATSSAPRATTTPRTGGR